MIYFIQSENGPIKIGYSKSPKQRIHNLRSANSEKLTLIGTVSGSRDKELLLHKQFKHLLISGEWFKPEQDLLDYINTFSEGLLEEDKIVLSHTAKNILIEIGRNIKLARLRRKIAIQSLAQQMGITRATLMKIEQGSLSSSIGNYLQVLLIFGMEKDLERIALEDPIGRKFQDDALLNTRVKESKSQRR